MFYASLERMQEAMHGISLKVCSRDKSPHLSFTDTRVPVEERVGMAHTLLSQPLEPALLKASSPGKRLILFLRGGMCAGHLTCLWLGRGHRESHRAITSIL